MFSGIIEAQGPIVSRSAIGDNVRLGVRAPFAMNIGDSVACNGVCLTVVASQNDVLFFDVCPQTLRTACFDNTVNLERPLSIHQGLHGHFVQGHVDGVVTISSKTPIDGGGYELALLAPQDLLCLVAPKGSVALDGVSVTVASVFDEGFFVSIIPHTAQVTTLGSKKVGDRLNIETDILAKYVQRMLYATQNSH